MGSVYLAEDERLRRPVALKVILPELAQQESFRRRFEAEARSAAAIEHPNIVPILSAGSAEGHLYLAMRHIEGSNLNQALDRHGPLDPEEAIRIVEGVAAALDAAHATGLVHRDVTPANILLEGELGRDGIYLTDFGLVRAVDSEETRLTRTDQVIANLDYAAPEQIKDGWIDARTDVYALGCVLFRMRSGSRPFPGTDTQKMWKIVNDPVPPISDQEDPLDPIIARATAKDPAKRYPSAGDLARAASDAVSGRMSSREEHSVATGAAASGYSETEEPGQATQLLETEVFVSREEPATKALPPSESRDGGRRRRRLGTAAAALLALVAGGVAAALIATAGGSDKPTTIVHSRTVTTPPRTETVVEEAPSTKPAEPVSNPALNRFNGSIYTTKVPANWQHSDEVEEEPPYYANLWSAKGDAGEPYVRVEGNFPTRIEDPVAAEEGSRRTTSKSSDYREISYGPVDVGGREAVRWEYEVEGDRRVVYGFIECGAGLGIVGSSSPKTFSTFASLFEEVADSTRILCSD